jgi:tungstate transport system substrate-binding protein
MKNCIKLALIVALLLAALPTAALAAPPAQAQAPNCVRSYVIVAADWLSKLADKYYGNPQAYPALVEATNQKHATDASFPLIEDPNKIEIGWKVCIVPADQAQAFLDQAAGGQKVVPAKTAGRLILATTTSTRDSGLLDYILPDFEAKYNVSVEVVAVGTGQALQLGTKGDADVELVHARAQEDAFVAAGDGINRQDVMYNDFIIIGPANDPAGIKGMKAPEAFAKIAQTGSRFISRGDQSGTNTKELAIWKAAGIEPKGDWYISAGQGMGAVLTMANEQLAYTLSDRATYLARTLKGIDLVILCEGDPDLLNRYGVIAVNPAKHPGVNSELANKFIDWITSVETQKLISTFGVKDFGKPLFFPESAQYKAAMGTK